MARATNKGANNGTLNRTHSVRDALLRWINSRKHHIKGKKQKTGVNSLLPCSSYRNKRVELHLILGLVYIPFVGCTFLPFSLVVFLWQICGCRFARNGHSPTSPPEFLIKSWGGMVRHGVAKETPVVDTTNTSGKLGTESPGWQFNRFFDRLNHGLNHCLTHP